MDVAEGVVVVVVAERMVVGAVEETAALGALSWDVTGERERTGECWRAGVGREAGAGVGDLEPLADEADEVSRSAWASLPAALLAGGTRPTKAVACLAAAVCETVVVIGGCWRVLVLLDWGGAVLSVAFGRSRGGNEDKDDAEYAGVAFGAAVAVAWRGASGWPVPG